MAELWINLWKNKGNKNKWIKWYYSIKIRYIRPDDYLNSLKLGLSSGIISDKSNSFKDLEAETQIP